MKPFILGLVGSLLSGKVILAKDAWDISFFSFKLPINFNISWSVDATPFIITWFCPSKSIELNLTLFGTEDAIWAKILKLIFLFDSIDPLNSKDLLIIPNSFANLAFSKVFNWCSETIWS